MNDIIVVRLDVADMPKENKKEYMEEVRNEIVSLIGGEIKVLVLPKTADVSILPMGRHL
jgi:hypothetical protein